MVALTCADVLRFPIAVLGLLALVASSATAGATIPYTAKRTTTCLSAHQVISNPVSKSRAVPAQFPAVAVLQFSFALVAAEALDHGNVVFERDAVTAKRVTTAWIAYAVSQAQRVQGINQKQALALVLQAISRNGNAITIWTNTHVKPASRARLSSCLR